MAPHQTVVLVAIYMRSMGLLYFRQEEQRELLALVRVVREAMVITILALPTFQALLQVASYTEEPEAAVVERVQRGAGEVVMVVFQAVGVVEVVVAHQALQELEALAATA